MVRWPAATMSHAWAGIHGIVGRRDRGPARQPDPRTRRAQVALRRAAGAVRAAPSHCRRERRGVGRAPRVRADARVAHHRAPRGARRHDQGRARSLRGDGGDRAHPRPQPRHRVRLEPGRLYAPMPVLRHGHPWVRPPAHRRGDRPAVPGGAGRGAGRLTDEGAPRLAARNVTVSTSSVVPGMERFLRECRAHLALSLNATTDAQRERLMPHTRTWPIAVLLDALRADHRRGSARRYFIEYVLWAGVNDS